MVAGFQVQSPTPGSILYPNAMLKNTIFYVHKTGNNFWEALSTVKHNCFFFFFKFHKKTCISLFMAKLFGNSLSVLKKENEYLSNKAFEMDDI